MKKYQQLAQQLTEQIALGVWLPGDRLPSLREQVISSGMSFMTVSHAYGDDIHTGSADGHDGVNSTEKGTPISF